MDRDVHLNRISSAQLLSILRDAQEETLGKATQSYLLCAAALARRRQELAARQSEKEETSALLRIISRLEDTQKAHLRLIKKLE